MKFLLPLLRNNILQLSHANQLRYADTKNRTKTITLYMLIAAILMGLLAYLIYSLKIIYSIAWSLEEVVTELVIPMVLICVSLNIAISVFWGSGLLLSDTNIDSMLALPIPLRTLILSKLTVLFMVEVALTVALLLPMMVLFGLTADMGFPFYLIVLGITIIFPVIPGLLGTMIGTQIYRILKSSSARIARLKAAAAILVLFAFMIFMFCKFPDISELVRNIGGNPDDASADNAVRVAPNPIVSNESGLMMWLVAGVFGVLFMFCGYLLIYNVFEIAVTNDIRQYGLLRTVGTTSRQIRRLVNRQALYLFLIGTPFGLLFGTLLGRSILPAALQIFAVDYSGGNIEVGTLPYLGIIVGAILFSGLTVYISTRKAVKKASRVSPIEAIRYVDQDAVSIKRKKTASGSVIPRLAKANLQRNKRRTVFIVISLTLSIVFLNSVFIFSSSFDEDVYIENQTRSDFRVYSPVIQAAWGDNFGHDSAVPEKAVEEIKEQPGVTNEAYLYRNTFEDDHISCDWGTPYVVDNTNKEQRMLPEHLNLGVYRTENGGHTVGLTADNHPLGNVFGFSENFFDRLDIIEGETDLSVLKNKLWNGNNVILMGEYDDHGNFAGAESAFYFGLSVGDTIQFYENGTPTKEFTIIAKAAATDGDVTVTGGGSNIAQIIEGPRIFMAENKFKEIYETPTLYGFLFDVEEQYQQEMETYLAQDTDVAYTSILTMKATVSGVKNVVLLIGGMIGAVFALVGLINFINLVMTNIITRRHEFATMQSIGMTNRQLRKMMISESFSYVLLAGIVGTLAAAVLGITLVRSFVEISPSSIMMTFQMTLLPALIMLILFLALAFIVPVVALRLFNNRSVVERLRVNE